MSCVVGIIEHAWDMPTVLREFEASLLSTDKIQGQGETPIHQAAGKQKETYLLTLLLFCVEITS